MKVDFQVELTDTYGGESNYSWVKRTSLESNSDSQRSIVQKAKAWCGFTGIPARVENYGDMIAIYPRGICQVAFVTFDN